MQGRQYTMAARVWRSEFSPGTANCPMLAGAGTLRYMAPELLMGQPSAMINDKVGGRPAG